jgi:hypothetical protein
VALLIMFNFLKSQTASSPLCRSYVVKGKTRDCVPCSATLSGHCLRQVAQTEEVPSPYGNLQGAVIKSKLLLQGYRVNLMTIVKQIQFFLFHELTFLAASESIMLRECSATNRRSKQAALNALDVNLNHDGNAKPSRGIFEDLRSTT